MAGTQDLSIESSVDKFILAKMGYGVAETVRQGVLRGARSSRNKPFQSEIWMQEVLESIQTTQNSPEITEVWCLVFGVQFSLNAGTISVQPPERWARMRCSGSVQVQTDS
jgi:hypothetical protein